MKLTAFWVLRLVVRALEPSSLSLRVTVASSQKRREAGKNRRYLELYIVADHTLVRGDPGGWQPRWDQLSPSHHLAVPFQFLTQHRNLNHTKQRLLEITNYVDQVGGGREIALVGVTGNEGQSGPNGMWQAWR